MSLQFVSVCDPRLFCIDMEWLGDLSRPSATYIYSVAIIHCATGNTFSIVIDPSVSARRLKSFPVYNKCRKVTKAWLKRENAVPFVTAFSKMREFIKAHSHVGAYGNPYKHNSKNLEQPSTTATMQVPPILVAHGGFKADKPVLLSAMRRTGTPFPPHWRWFDSLYFFRRVMPAFRGKYNGYSLHDVASTVGIDFLSFGRQHDAYPDAKTLYETLKTFPHLFGSVYGWHETALTNVPGIGLSGEAALMQHNIRCVEDLLTFVAHCSTTISAEEKSLRTPFVLARAYDSSPPVYQKEKLENCVVRRLHNFGIPRASRIAKWCVGAVTIFNEKN